jgi:multidrug efflux pump subunit AcrA (membrane-fusion protein)
MARSRKLRTGLVVGGAVVVAALVGGGIAYAQSGSTPGYRTAAVTRGPISAGLDMVGTIVPIHSATVGFAQAGTVAAVDVSLGSRVTAGQPVAQLDLTSLRARLAQAKAVEAAARQTLAEAENGQLPSATGGGSGGASSGGSGGASSGGTVRSGPSSSGTSGRSSSSADTAVITGAQRGVVSAQKAVDAARTLAQRDLRAATVGCSASGHTPPDTQACLAAETTLLTAQQDLAAKESAVSAAQSTLSKALATASSSAAASRAATPAATMPAAAPVSAAALAAYQAAVDADVAEVAVAQQNLDQGTAVSPLSGTVVAVGLTRGQAVAASSSTAGVTVSASDGYQATAVVPVAAINQVTMGQRATIVEDGNPATLTGTVVSIGATPTASGYPVTIGLPASAPGLRQGMSASLRLVTGQISSAVVVPTSAVHTFGTRHVVEVVAGGTMTPTVVTIGAMDPLRTQVLTGVSAGQQVALADLSSTVTSDSSTSGSGGGLGGLTGRGLGGGRAFGGGTGRAFRAGG